MTIIVFGTGCPKCQMTERNTRQALADLNLEAQIEHVRDPLQIARYVMFTPALAIDGEVKVSGKVPSVEEIKGWLQG